MRRFILPSVILLIGVQMSWAQPIDAGPNLNVCPGTPISLSAVINPGMPAAGPETQLPNIMSCDDCSSPVVNIGFPFTFYGNSYTQCVVTSNGYITFNLASANGYSPWSISSGIPNGSLPTNAIMAPWHDINPALTGANDIIRYQTFGTAPNRVFIVEYLDVGMFSCGVSFCYGAQIKLFEGTNVIETHIANKPLCASWNSGYAIHGLQNASGTLAAVVPGRNFPNQWVATNDGKRFTPSGSNYTITNIPFNPTIMGTIPPASSFQWYVAGNPTIIATGTTLNVTPNTTTSYVIKYTYSSCGGFSFTDTVKVTMSNLVPVITGANAYCPGGNTTLSTSSSYASYLWATGATSSSITATAGSYTVQVTDANGCTGVSAAFNVVENPLPQPVITGTPAYCVGDSVQLQTTTAYVSYEWSQGATTSSIYAHQGSYTITVTDANGCINSSPVFNVIENPLPIPIIQGQNIYCEGGPNVLTVNNLYNQYLWSNGSNNASITLNGGSGTYTVTVTDANGCTGTSSPFITTEVILQPTINGIQAFCEGASISVGVDNGPYAQYLWSNGDHAEISLATGGNLTVTVTDTNGCSKSATAFIPATPNPIASFYATPQPAFISAPIINFLNTSSVDAVTYQWDFSGLGSSNEYSTYFEFDEAGFYDVTLQVWNYLGCTSTTTQTIEIKPQSLIFIPNAFTPNGDELNNTFFPKGNNLIGKHIEVHVFNRWGQRMYYGTSVDAPWDGTYNGEMCPPGVYAYRIYYKDDEGKIYRFMGNVNLIR